MIRTNKQIREAQEEFFDRIWYNRKLVMLDNILQGKEDMPPEEIMDSMTDAMREIEVKYDKDSLLYDDFEWGIINGKLSALRWILGDDWDMLDT